MCACGNGILYTACINPGCGDEDVFDLDQRTGLCGMCSRASTRNYRPERSCFTCRHSPPAPEPGCAALVVDDEGDPTHDAIVDYCEASGVNDEDNPMPGFPTDRTISCAVWERR